MAQLQKSEDETTDTHKIRIANKTNPLSGTCRRYIYMSMYMSVLFVLNILYTIRAYLQHAILITLWGKIKVSKLFIRITLVK